LFSREKKRTQKNKKELLGFMGKPFVLFRKSIFYFILLTFIYFSSFDFLSFSLKNKKTKKKIQKKILFKTWKKNIFEILFLL
jgi:hypothetical protein